MRMPSVMSHNFSQVPTADIQRSRFDRSCGYKTTFNAGFLVPFFVDEVLPGDTFNLRATIFARLATPIVPLMDNMYLDTFYFFVPNRLLWDNWQKFNGEQKNPGDSTDFLVPQVTVPGGGFANGSLFDYFGIPTSVSLGTVCALWPRAYNLTYNEWFRDENLQNSVPVNRGDGPDAATDYALLRRGKRHDYFTSALPWPQKGPAVALPLGQYAPIEADGGLGIRNGSNVGGGRNILANVTGSNLLSASGAVFTAGDPMYYASGLRANLAAATSATINALRTSFQIQKLYERDARGGTRYTEIIRSHFGVVSPDARLQRPEYLGGGSSPIIVNPIAQTSANAAQPSPLGNLGAMGTVTATGHGFNKSFVEHGVVIGLCMVRADLNYQQGLNRMWSRKTRWDFYWPALAHIGEQTVLNKEIYAAGVAADNNVFGYQERFAEYRYKPSLVTGQFRSNFPQTLDIWHLAQNFASLPSLNSTFIQENPPMERIKAVSTYPDFILDSYTNLTCARPMPLYSVPGLIDHF